MGEKKNRCTRIAHTVGGAHTTVVVYNSRYTTAVALYNMCSCVIYEYNIIIIHIIILYRVHRAETGEMTENEWAAVGD